LAGVGWGGEEYRDVRNPLGSNFASPLGSSANLKIYYGIALNFRLNQGCGSGLDPDLVTLWIRIRIGNPDPDPEK
jgi:hypothetical protein